MLSTDCKYCRYCKWMVAIGMGIRCGHDENQEYKQEDDTHKNLPVIISHIPENCPYRTTSNESC